MSENSEIKSESTSPKSRTRRDFLMLASGAMGGVGAASFVVPFIDSMNPAADTLAAANVDVDLSQIAVGQSITVMWRGKPLFVRHRTEDEISSSVKVESTQLPDPETDQARVIKPEWLVVIGVCTHLGCVPSGQRAGENKGSFGGWFCPCHGSEYDVSGRIRRGPAPTNLPVPPYYFIDETTIRVGQQEA